jgi:hypothetical protein
MEYMFHSICFLDLSKIDFVATLQDAERRKRLERQCELRQESEVRHRAQGRGRGHAVVFRSNGLCWGWLDVKDSLETALSKPL